MDETGSRMSSSAGAAIRARRGRRVAIFIRAVTVRGAAVSVGSVVAGVSAARVFVVDGDFAAVLQLIETIHCHHFAGVHALYGCGGGVSGANGDVAQSRCVVRTDDVNESTLRVALDGRGG